MLDFVGVLSDGEISSLHSLSCARSSLSVLQSVDVDGRSVEENPLDVGNSLVSTKGGSQSREKKRSEKSEFTS